jgi:hypothetical protein
MRRLLPALSLALLLAGCARLPAHWDYLDLRLLDPADDAPSPETDLVALYARQERPGPELRVDFLDFVEGQTPDRVYIAFDMAAGGSRSFWH